jgi:hypothetical protein
MLGREGRPERQIKKYPAHTAIADNGNTQSRDK